MNENNEGAVDAKPPYRGDIIVDTDALFNLCPNIPQEDGISSGRYLQILPFLAKNGYRIIIPEMVAYEAGGVLASGADVASCFINIKSAHKILSSLLKDAALPEGDTLKQHPGITVQTKTGPEKVDGFLESLEENIKNFDKLKNQAASSKNSSKEREKLRLEILQRDSLQHTQSIDKKNYGDDAIISLIKRNYKETDTPLFVLSNDVQLLAGVGEGGRACAVKVSEFVFDIYDSGLGEKCGFPSSISIGELEKKRWGDLQKIISNNRQFIGGEPLNEHAKSSRYRGGALFESFKQLAQDLKQQESVEPQAPARASGDRVAKFLQKYGKHNLGNSGHSL